MNWDLIIFLLILISFFIGLILFVKRGPIYFAKYRAKTFGLELTLEEAEIVQKSFLKELRGFGDNIKYQSKN